MVKSKTIINQLIMKHFEARIELVMHKMDLIQFNFHQL
ncbi:hypothetical protein P872_01075 [Rhodonellum psychrophilum GCM71 = DSM 17998]|uniref:Uncharacterized protein n=2 Tax=Rhodonellum TaxID=336827 RepID=U5BTG0_9BACT|nr:hypothetical protein P872_01075 [Rhodonellum psychrophilum GCM71 = DSM 17998]SDZ04274.1 hypothetical protein SAMN05444412_1052 [Rhodonellum ikkaensis]